MSVVIVTGATGNLGKAVTDKFIEEGYTVVAVVTPGRRRPGNDKGDRLVIKEADLSDEKALEILVEETVAIYGAIDSAVFTAGGFAMAAIADTSAADLLEQYRLNFETAYTIGRVVFKQMSKQGSGRIFFIGSKPGSAMQYSKGMVAYGLSKSLVFRFAELINEEAGKKDIVASVIVPSIIDTPQNREAMPDADFSKWVSPEAIAAIIYFYSSKEASLLREPVIKVYGSV